MNKLFTLTFEQTRHQLVNNVLKGLIGPEIYKHYLRGYLASI